MKTKVLIVDDHRMFLDGLVSILERSGDFELFGATDAGQAMNLINTQSFELAILDVEMPDSELNGVDLTKYISRQCPETRILVVSMNKSAETVDGLIAAGAHGYLIKDSGYETLLQAIKTLEYGKEYWDPKILQLMVDARRDQAKTTESSAKMSEVVLTGREKDVLIHLATGLSSKAIGDVLCIGTSTVETHRKNLIAKFGAKNSTDVVMRAKDRGLI